MIYFQSLTKAELAELIKPLSRKVPRSLGNGPLDPAVEAEIEKKAEKQARYRAQQIYRWVYQRFVTDWDEMSDLSKELRAWLKENVQIYRLSERHSRHNRKRNHPCGLGRKRRRRFRQRGQSSRRGEAHRWAPVG